jgi:hypothetical protein
LLGDPYGCPRQAAQEGGEVGSSSGGRGGVAVRGRSISYYLAARGSTSRAAMLKVDAPRGAARALQQRRGSSHALCLAPYGGSGQLEQRKSDSAPLPPPPFPQQRHPSLLRRLLMARGCASPARIVSDVLCWIRRSTGGTPQFVLFPVPWCGERKRETQRYCGVALSLTHPMQMV